MINEGKNFRDDSEMITDSGELLADQDLYLPDNFFEGELGGVDRERVGGSQERCGFPRRILGIATFLLMNCLVEISALFLCAASGAVFGPGACSAPQPRGLAPGQTRHWRP